MYRYIAIVIIFIIGVSCIPDPLPVGKIPQLQPRIVVSTQMIDNETVLVLLTKSIGALDASNDSDFEELLNQIAINDAVVIIENELQRDTLVFIETGIYVGSQLELISGQSYRLVVNSEEMGSVTAIAPVQQQITFQTLTAEIFDNGFDTLLDVSMTFNDLPGKNYFMFNAQRFSEEQEPQDFLNPGVFTRLSEDDGIDDERVLGDDFLVFAQRDFVPGDTVAFFLSNISPDYFNFMKLRQDNRFNFSDFLGEPVNYPSNVEGGLGWFTLHLPDVRILVVE